MNFWVNVSFPLPTVVLCLKYLAAGEVVALDVTGDPSEVLDTVSGSSENIWVNEKKIFLICKLYFQLDVQDICLARMFQVLLVVSPYVVFSVTESVAATPNSTYTLGGRKFSVFRHSRRTYCGSQCSSRR